MNKQKLVRFINKYYLNGIADSVVLKSNAIDQKLSTRFVSSDKTLLGKGIGGILKMPILEYIRLNNY